LRSLSVSCPAASRIRVRTVVDDFPSLISVFPLLGPDICAMKKISQMEKSD